jgi:hypothetical protein
MPNAAWNVPRPAAATDSVRVESGVAREAISEVLEALWFKSAWLKILATASNAFS